MAFRIKKRQPAPPDTGDDNDNDNNNIEDNSGTNLDGYNTDVTGDKNVVAT